VLLECPPCKLRQHRYLLPQVLLPKAYLSPRLAFHMIQLAYLKIGSRRTLGVTWMRGYLSSVNIESATNWTMHEQFMNDSSKYSLKL
jgi:hypothetical protein